MDCASIDMDGDAGSVEDEEDSLRECQPLMEEEVREVEFLSLLTLTDFTAGGDSRGVGQAACLQGVHVHQDVQHLLRAALVPLLDLWARLSGGMLCSMCKGLRYR